MTKRIEKDPKARSPHAHIDKATIARMFGRALTGHNLKNLEELLDREIDDKDYEPIFSKFLQYLDKKDRTKLLHFFATHKNETFRKFAARDTEHVSRTDFARLSNDESEEVLQIVAYNRENPFFLRALDNLLSVFGTYRASYRLERIKAVEEVLRLFIEALEARNFRLMSEIVKLNSRQSVFEDYIQQKESVAKEEDYDHSDYSGLSLKELADLGSPGKPLSTLAQEALKRIEQERQRRAMGMS